MWDNSKKEADRGNEAEEMAVRVVKDRGFRYDKGSEYCKEQQKKYGNCTKCESLTGCRRVSGLLALLYLAEQIKVSSLTDLLKLKKVTDIAKTAILARDVEREEG